LAAGTARLQRPPGGVQPYIDSLNQVAGHVVVIVLYEYDAAPEVFGIAELGDSLQEFLALIVPRVCLAGKDDLDRVAGIINEPGQALGLR
jgi:hypothetical protein